METQFYELLVLISAMLVFLMQAGFTEAGMTRRKNSMNIAMKNLAHHSMTYHILCRENKQFRTPNQQDKNLF